MAIFRVVNEAVSVPVRASLVTGQSATYEEAQDNSVLALDRYGRPNISFAAIDRGGYIYTEQADEDTLDNNDATGTYVGGAAAVKRLVRKGAVVEDDSLAAAASTEDTAEEASTDATEDEKPKRGRRGGNNNS